MPIKTARRLKMVHFCWRVYLELKFRPLFCVGFAQKVCFGQFKSCCCCCWMLLCWTISLDLLLKTSLTLKFCLIQFNLLLTRQHWPFSHEIVRDKWMRKLLRIYGCSLSLSSSQESCAKNKKKLGKTQGKFFQENTF